MEVYWRVKGTAYWHYGWKTSIGDGLVHMGLYNGDTTRGPVFDLVDIETRQYKRV